ncbi:hypothetical protein ACH4D5_26275 [Streptomyces sp. NPDC018029]|uniref:hypothetical protein n=1 Tax=Streptomyces sp. NPDC018029 TaxID=3365032 RepID=UPI0037A70BA7
MATLDALLAALTELRGDLEAHGWQPDEHERVVIPNLTGHRVREHDLPESDLLAATGASS